MTRFNYYCPDWGLWRNVYKPRVPPHSNLTSDLNCFVKNEVVCYLPCAKGRSRLHSVAAPCRINEKPWKYMIKVSEGALCSSVVSSQFACFPVKYYFTLLQWFYFKLVRLLKMTWCCTKLKNKTGHVHMLTHLREGKEMKRDWKSIGKTLAWWELSKQKFCLLFSASHSTVSICDHIKQFQRTCDVMGFSRWSFFLYLYHQTGVLLNGVSRWPCESWVVHTSGFSVDHILNFFLMKDG